MNWYKTAKLNFTNLDVRRLMGILADHKDLSGRALEEMTSWLNNEETDITLNEAVSRLSYYLDRMGIK